MAQSPRGSLVPGQPTVEQRNARSGDGFRFGEGNRESVDLGRCGVEGE